MDDNKTPKTTAEWFERGRQCFHQPDGVGAVNAMNRVVDMDPAYRHPDGDNPHFYLGKISEVEDRLEDALVHYSRALAVDPWDEESLIGRGSCYTVTRRHEEAIADFKKLLRFPANRRKVDAKHLYYVIAENYRQMEDWQNALAWCRRALQADPHNDRHQELFREVQARLHP